MDSKGLGPLPRKRGSTLARGCDRGGRVVLPLARAYHRFLTELSERPGRHLAISAHLVPSLACIFRMIWSSSGVHAPFFSVGSRLLHQRSRHCLPVRPGSMLAMCAQCLPPYWLTSSISCASSFGHQGPLTFSVFKTVRHLSIHCAGVRPSNCSASSCQTGRLESRGRVCARPRPPPIERDLDDDIRRRRSSSARDQPWWFVEESS